MGGSLKRRSFCMKIGGMVVIANEVLARRGGKQSIVVTNHLSLRLPRP
jgi:hypothetical protein